MKISFKKWFGQFSAKPSNLFSEAVTAPAHWERYLAKQNQGIPWHGILVALHAAMNICTSLCSSVTHRVCCSCHGDCIKPGEVSLNTLCFLPVAAVWTRIRKGCSCSMTSIMTRADQGCVYSAFCCVKRKTIVYHWSQLEPFDGFFLSSLCLQFNKN